MSRNQGSADLSVTMRRRKATTDDIENFWFMGRFSSFPERLQECRKALEEGKLEFVESGIEDPNGEYTALVADGEKLAALKS